MGRNKIHLTWLTAVLLTAAIGIGLFMWQRQRNDDEVANLSARIAELTGESVDSQTAGSDDSTGERTSSIERLPVVVFEPAGLFDDDLIQEFRDGVINPITLYSADNDTPVAAMLIETSQVEGEYVVNIIREDGGYEGFLTGGDRGVSWEPTCLDRCVFSDEFTEKYPDIAASSSTQTAE